MTGLVRGRYEPSQLVARGGQGEVWRALDTRHGRNVTLKIRTSASEEESEELLREVRILLELSHEHLPVVREDFSERQRHYIVMDWVDGIDLEQMLQQQGDPGLPYQSVLRYLEDAARALEYLHERHVVHGDVKPANLVLAKTGKVILVDFGLARHLGQRSRGATPGYGAPETAGDEPITSAVDVFGLAATATALLSGTPPEGRPTWEGIPAALAGAAERVLGPALATAPEQRPRSASGLLLGLRAAWRDAELPNGTVTFLLSDAGETRHGSNDADELRRGRVRHHELLRTTVARHHGSLLDYRDGRDGHVAVFRRPTDGVGAARGLLREVAAQPPETSIPLRLALHTGEAEPEEGTYRGPALEWCLRLRGLAHEGQALVSQSCGQLVRGHLPPDVTLRDLGALLGPHPGEVEQVMQLVVDGVSPAFPPLISTAAPPSALPAQLTTFVGRKGERLLILEDLTAHRLVTITGPAGVGKTRLALDAAAHINRQHPDRVAFVDLDAIADPELVVHAVAKAVRLQEGVNGIVTADRQEGPPFLQRLATVVGSRSVLFVLDNCDHLLEACATVVQELLSECPQVSILCTSRWQLEVEGEFSRRLDPLAFPQGANIDSQAIRTSEAVQLFLDRSVSRRAGSEPAAQELRTILAICQGLDGVPYAIELAAARTGVLSPSEILARIPEPLGLLTKGRRGSTPARRSMRAMIEISDGLLSQPQRALLRRLAVFRGGFGLPAVQEVCEGEGIEAADVLDLLQALVASSLVEARPGRTETRYRLLETTRQYARELLTSQRDEEQRVIERHRRWYLRLAERAEPEIRGPEQIRWLNILEREQDNLQLALEPDGPGAQEGALRLAAALASYWLIRGYIHEGRSHLRRALVAQIGAGPERAKALAAAGALAIYDADLETARLLSEEALPLSRAAGDRTSEATALHTLSTEAERQSRFTAANRLAEQCQEVARAAGDQRLVAMSMARLGALAELRGEFAEARRFNEEALRVRRPAGDLWDISWSLYSLGKVALWQGRSGAAEHLLGEGLFAAQALDSGHLAILFMIALGHGAWRQANLSSAEAHFRSALDQAATVQEQYTTAQCLIGLADTATGRQDYAGAEAWLGRLDRHDPLLRYTTRASALRVRGRLAAATGERTEALAHHREALEIRDSQGDALRIAVQLEEIAYLLAEEDPERATKLLAATLALRDRGGAPVPPIYDDDRRRATERMQAALSPRRYATHWSAGARLSLAEAVALERSAHR